MATRPFRGILPLRAGPDDRGHRSRRTLALALSLAVSACGPREGSAPTDPAAGDTTPEASQAPESAGSTLFGAGDTTSGRSPDPGLDSAIRRLASGDRAGARALLEDVLSRQPENARARFYLGLTYYREHRHARAAELFERSREAGSTFQGADEIAHFHGWSLFHLGRLAEARKAFETHLGKSPDSADTLSGLGRIAWETGHLQDAAGYLKRALEAERRTRSRPARIAKYLVQLADVHTRQGEIEKARDELGEAAAVQPDHYSVYYKLYHLYSDLGDSVRAEEAFRRYQASWTRARAQKTGGI